MELNIRRHLQTDSQVLRCFQTYIGLTRLDVDDGYRKCSERGTDNVHLIFESPKPPAHADLAKGLVFETLQ